MHACLSVYLYTTCVNAHTKVALRWSMACLQVPVLRHQRQEAQWRQREEA